MAGPVVAAAVVLPSDYKNPLIRDSKTLTVKQREKLYDEIHHNAIAIGIGLSDNEVIDKINILEASRQAMMYAIEKLSIFPDAAIIDAVNTGTMADLDAMAIGTGTGQGVGDTVLSSKVSTEVSSGSEWTQTDNGDDLDTIATFENASGGSWTITEAGCFNDGAGNAGMYLYNDGLSVALSDGDTLQITWNLAVS